MNILKWGTFGMMSDVVASSAVKVQHLFCMSFVLGQIITQQQTYVTSTCTKFGILVPSKKQNSFVPLDVVECAILQE
jgi:hypothetical protein